VTTPVHLSASVIVATRNRAAHLARLLHSLTHLTYPRFEVIVVAGPGTDDTPELVQAWADRVKVVHSPVASMCASRNLGLAQASGDVVVFIDDDAIPATAEWLDHLVAPFARSARIAATGGPVLLQDGDVWQFRNGCVSEWGEHVFVAAPDDPLPTSARWFRRAMGTNMAFRRAPLLAIGGFDARITYYGDECDVCVRLARAGWEFVSVDQAVVRHYPAPTVHRHLIERTRIVAHDDTYAVMRNAAAPWLVRAWRMLRMLPRRHYVLEAREARRAGRVTAAEYRRFTWLLIVGVAAGMADASLRSRLTAAPSSAPPHFKGLVRPEPARRMSVALLARQLACDGPCEGPARYTFDLAEGLHALGHDVHVIGESPTPRRYHRLGFTVHGIARSDMPSHLLPAQPILDANLVYASAVADRLRVLEQGGRRLDIVHATNWNFEGIGAVIDGRVPVVMMLVTSLAEVIVNERWTMNADLEAGVWLDRAQIRAAAALCAPTRGLVSRYVATDLLDEASAATVRVCGLGIVPRLGRARGIVTGQRLLFVGTHVRRKGLDDLLAVLPDLLARFGDWSCDIAGDDTRRMEDGRTLRDAFVAAHVNAPWLDRVTFHGRVADARLWDLYRAAAIYVVPSHFESFGLTYLEAMQFGVPVVATTAGGIPEVVAHGVTGELVPPGDRDALRETLAGLMHDGGRRAALGERARDHVRQSGTHVHMAARLAAVYETVLRAPRPDGSAPRGRVRGVIDMIEAARAPADLVVTLRGGASFDGGVEEREQLVRAALGQLPSAALYLIAIDRCLERGAVDRAARLLIDAREYATHLRDEDFAQLADRRRLMAHLGVDANRAAEDEPPPGQSTLAEALGLLREGRSGAAMAALFTASERQTAPESERLLARYHLASACKRAGLAAQADRDLRRLVATQGFERLPNDVQAAAWFHLGDLALAREDHRGATEALTRCLALNPAHARATALLQADVQPGARSGS
jgi:glycogen(starch) synthase